MIFQTFNNATAAEAFHFVEYTPADLFQTTYWQENDMWTQYNDCVVTGFKYHIQFNNINTSNGVQVSVLPWPSNEDPTTKEEMTQNNNAKTKVLSHALGARSTGTMRGYVSTARLFGIRNVEIEEDFYCQETTSPQRGCRFYVGFYNMGAQAVQNVEYIVRITAYVTWFNREQQT